MQPSALPDLVLPDLAHNRTSPVHWLATATAMAGVVALAGVLAPDPATASQPGGKPARPHVAAPDPAAVTFPLECGGAGTTVTRKASGDLDGDGSPETVAAVRCDAGSGTPPTGIYVLTRPGTGDGRPRLVATLVSPADQQSVGALAIGDGAVTATLLGYSSPDVPRWNPDVHQQVKWRWQGGKFVRSVPSQARSV
ncbi:MULTISPECIES: hypothetical protein [unclassified Streptomyces]|uniref:hypothetical protein n=1 Tax=unclassified Streptomyces TaxID=2593676 RepID=UPI002E10AEB7|nr:hypothetical protein OG452_29210 [Streptomyces sp. NBC_01197]WSS48163.1 hypothetical protein OG708_05645 [Streptomyces sp. NBC_01180]